MHLHRELLGTYLIVFGGLVVGITIGVLFTNTNPAIVGWFFAGGAGLGGGAFVAANTAGVQLVGSQPTQERYIAASRNGHTPPADVFEEATREQTQERSGGADEGTGP